ncbi:MAG: hypothetical protein JW818_05880 [Pirellulales bacterium]|nr:hypothetical protein [Pirellulales bacterium]
MRTVRQISLAMTILTTTAMTATATEMKERTFAVPQHGNLVLNLPADWKQSIKNAPGLPVPLIMLAPAQGNAFEILVTPFWSPKNDPTFNNAENVKRLVGAMRTQMLPKAVEKQVELKEIKGATSSGYYFLVTDKAPKPGEFPYAVSAGLGVGDLLLHVTLLCRDKNDPAIETMLKALQQAKQTK